VERKSIDGEIATTTGVTSTVNSSDSATSSSATSSSSRANATSSSISSSSDTSKSRRSDSVAADVSAKSLDLSGLQEQFMCGICDEVMVDAWSFGCNGGHANCKQCVLPWVKQHATCPQCQSKVSLPGNRNVPADQIIEAAVTAEVVDSEEANGYWSRRGMPAPDADVSARSLDLSGLQEQFMCGICDEVMVDAWSFGCSGGHANCKQCVLPWVKQHATCPQCQSKVSLPGNRNVPVDQIIEAAVIAEVVDPEEATRYWSRRGLPAPARASSSSGPPLTLAATQGVRADSAETHAPDSAPAPSQPAVAPIFTSKRNKNRSRGSTGSSERTSSKVIDVDNNSSFNDAEVSNKLAFVAFVAFVALNLPSNVA